MEKEYYFMLLLVGSSISIGGILNLVKALCRSCWPSTNGKIIENSIEKRTKHIELAEFDTAVRSKSTLKRIGYAETGFQDRLRYQYSVNGNQYLGAKLYSAPIGIRRYKAIEGLERGDTVKVFYNPRLPQIAYLAQSFRWPSYLSIFVGGVVVGVSVYVQHSL